MNLRFNKFYSPDEGAGSGSEPTTDLDTFELLNVDEPAEKIEPLPLDPLDDDEDEDKAETKVQEKEETEDVDELAELEKELKTPSEEDLTEIVTPVRRKEILTKYPNLFKDFPYLEKAYYREQQFTETFPTIQDARIAAEKASILDRTEREVMNGDISLVLRAAKEESGEAFNKIADNYLGTLRKVDQQAYYHVLGNVIKDTIITMVREGRNLGDQGAPLTAAANVLNQFIFGSQTFTPPSQLSQRADPQEQGRQQAQQQANHDRIMNQFVQTRDDLQLKADNVLKATIDGHIDPNKSMSEYVKGHATQEAFDQLESLISKDARFKSLLDKLWERAFHSGFDKESTDRIKSAYLSKAKTLLPSVIKSARNKALKDMPANTDAKPTSRGPIAQGKSGSPSTRYRKPSDIPKGMSTLDVLMKD